jgi:hypothetical protein
MVTEVLDPDFAGVTTVYRHIIEVYEGKDRKEER